MSSNQQSGDEGEKDIINHVSCPNCNKKLMTLPKNYPLYDVQCSACSFRAQVKTTNGKPRSIIFGAGWDIMEKVLKSGFITPPIFTNFKWIENGVSKQEVRFYPFIPKNTLKKYTLSEKARRANYKMFHYTNLDKLPYFIVYKK